MKKVAVVGSGAWGTAIASVLAHNGLHVVLLTHEEEVVQAIKKKRINDVYLPNVLLSSSVEPTTDAAYALNQVEWVFEAVPVKYMRQILTQLSSEYVNTQTWVVLSKGIEQDTLMLPTQILDDVFGNDCKKAVVVGPSFAKDVVQQQLTAVNVASMSVNTLQQVQEVLQNDYFKVFPSDDVIGVQLCAALKNAITLGVGILDGSGYTDNTKTFFLIQSLQEMRELVVACGGKSQTVDGLAGIGDLVLTALGKQSRNLDAGRKLGAGKTPEQICMETRCVPEGFNTVQSMGTLLQRNNLHLPLLQSLFLIITGQKQQDILLSTLTGT